jgi:hypothetical protein
LKVVFLLKYQENPQDLKETEHRKKESKSIEKKEKEKEREKERKRKAPRVSSNKKGKSIF